MSTYLFLIFLNHFIFKVNWTKFPSLPVSWARSEGSYNVTIWRASYNTKPHTKGAIMAESFFTLWPSSVPMSYSFGYSLNIKRALNLHSEIASPTNHRCKTLVAGLNFLFKHPPALRQPSFISLKESKWCSIAIRKSSIQTIALAEYKINFRL